MFTDSDGRDWCVAVVKATYTVGANGHVSVADKQEPLVFADQHFGDPGETSARYESDFAPYKPMVDILVNGHVYPPGGQVTTECNARLHVGNLAKTLRAIGRRHWVQGRSVVPSDPEPFERVELRYENTFGGIDNSHADEEHHGADMRNPLGCGFRKNPDEDSAIGQALPQLEYAADARLAWKMEARPASLGIVGRGWQPRLGFAGTYDDKWREERAPFLPSDFDMHYFQTAPADQQVPVLEPGTMAHLEHLTPQGLFSFAIPEQQVPVVFRFNNREERPKMMLDTLLIEPDDQRFLLSWRTKVPLGRKSQELREVQLGEAGRSQEGVS